MNDIIYQEANTLYNNSMNPFPEDVPMGEFPVSEPFSFQNNEGCIGEDDNDEEEEDIDFEELDKVQLPDILQSDLSSSPSTVLQFHGHDERLAPSVNNTPALESTTKSFQMDRSMQERSSELFEGQESGSCLYNKNFMASLDSSADKLRAENAKLRQKLGITAHEAFASIAAEYKVERTDTLFHQSTNPLVIDGDTLTFLQKYWA